MQIKRRLTALAKCMTPEIESMNVARQMEDMCKRMEELVAYAEEKISRSKTRGKTIGAHVAEARAAEDKIIKDHQQAEAEENLKDQQESFNERNRILAKSNPAAAQDETVAGADPGNEFSPEFDVSEDSDIEANADEEAELARKHIEANIPARKKAKKKK